jgi:Cu(I)/Ag(I) efflux system membrane fusion protein
MKDDKTTRINWQGIVPRGRTAIISMIVVAIVAFSLGGLFLGGNSATESTNGETHIHAGKAESSSEPSLWTCSMHPQIQLPKPGKCPICFMDLIPVESGGGGGDLEPNQIRMSETARKLAHIQVTPVTRAYAERSIRMVGKLDYDERKVAYITAWVPGRLDSLFVDYTGVKVNKGDHMVQVYSPELISAQEELLQAIKVVNELSGSASSVLRTTAQETLESAREKLRLYGLTGGQIQEIEKTGKPRHQLMITAPIGGVVVHKDAKEGMYVQTGTRIYTIADLSTLWVLLEAYESDLPWLKYGQHITFTSPSFPGEKFDAVISFIDPVVNPQTRTIDIRAIVQNNDGRLKPEMFINGVVRSRLDGEGNVIEPSLAGKWIGPMHPEIVKDHPGKCDICGMDLVPAEQLGFSTQTAASDDAPLLIPASAPLITGKRAVVYVQIPDDEGPVFEGREVVLGPRAGDYYIVKQGLKEGEPVVTNGAFKIDSEMQIQAKPSMMSPEGTAAIASHQHGEPGASKQMAVTEPKAYEFGNAERVKSTQKAQEALIPVYETYFDVQMALANDDLDAARKAFADLVETTQAVDMEAFDGEAHMRWMDISMSLGDAARRGAESESIEGARDAFYGLSLAAIELHDTFGHTKDTTYYLTYCPMARDSKGAYWLQQENIVWNSFYGDAMLRCGEIKQKLSAGGAGTE